MNWDGRQNRKLIDKRQPQKIITSQRQRAIPSTFTTTSHTQPIETHYPLEMGREIQKKKRRSARQPVRQTNRPKRPLNPLGNSTIAANWYNPPSSALDEPLTNISIGTRTRPSRRTTAVLDSQPVSEHLQAALKKHSAKNALRKTKTLSL